MDSESERIEKQNYLRKMVIEQGYEPDRFITYLQSVKGKINIIIENGEDVDNWEMDELVDIVDKFIKLETGGQTDTNDNPEYLEVQPPVENEVPEIDPNQLIDESAPVNLPSENIVYDKEENENQYNSNHEVNEESPIQEQNNDQYQTPPPLNKDLSEIGRASCRVRVSQPVKILVVAVAIEKKYP